MHAFVLAALVGLPSSAFADTGTARVTASDGVLFPGCFDHPYQFSLDLPAGTTSWSLDITALGPDSTWAWSDYRYGFVEDQPPGTGNLYLCQNLDGPGTYTLKSVLRYTDEDWNEHSSPVPDDTFILRFPGTRTGLSASPLRPADGQEVRFLLSSRVQAAGGYVANRAAAVRLERYVSQRWALVSGSSMTTDADGRAVFRMRWYAGSRHRYRAVTLRTGGSTRSESSSVTVPSETTQAPGTSPSLKVSPSRAITRERVRHAGSLAATGFRTVLLQRYAAGKWTSVARATTTRAGLFSFVTTAGSTSRRFRVLAPATARRAKIVTPARWLDVVKQSASIWVPSSSMVVGRSGPLTLTFAPTRTGRPVRVQRWTGSGWVTVKSGTQNQHGQFTFSLTPETTGAHSYRAVGPAFNGAARVVSATRQITVAPNPTTLVSRGTGGGTGNGGSLDPSTSFDGTLVTYASIAGNIVDGDNNGEWDVFVFDSSMNSSTMISHGTGEAPGNGWSGVPAISADGRYVAFASEATNLAAGDTNGAADIFMHDRSTGLTVKATTGLEGTPANGSSYRPSISGDGRFVTFESEASNLTDGDTNASKDVFIWDRDTGETTMVSIGADGGPTNGASFDNAVSADGRFVAFASQATNVVSGDTNGYGDVYVWERSLSRSTLISVGGAGEPADGHSTWPTISADGQVVAYETGATNIAGEGGHHRVIAWDRSNGSSRALPPLINPIGSTGPSYFDSFEPSMSADGSQVAFTFRGRLTAEGNLRDDVFIWHWPTGKLVRAAVTPAGGYPTGDSYRAALAGDGQSVAYVSSADDVQPNDNNNTWDVLLFRS